MWPHSKTQIVTKLKNSNCDTTELRQSSKTLIVTKLKKIRLWQNLKTQIVTKLKNSYYDETKNLNCDNSNSNWDKTQELKLWPNLKTQIVTKLKVSTGNKTKNLCHIFCNPIFSKNKVVHWQPRDVFWAAFLSFVKIWVRSKKFFLFSFFVAILSLVSIWVFEFYHNLFFWLWSQFGFLVLSQFKFLNFVKVLVW